MSADPFADLVARVADMHAQALDHEAQIHDLLEEREELLTEIRRLQRDNHPAGRALRVARERGRLHDCATCAECLHDGRKCCGCYDGACCQQGRALRTDATPNPFFDALAEALTERDAEHEGGAS